MTIYINDWNAPRQMQLGNSLWYWSNFNTQRKAHKIKMTPSEIKVEWYNGISILSRRQSCHLLTPVYRQLLTRISHTAHRSWDPPSNFPESLRLYLPSSLMQSFTRSGWWRGSLLSGWRRPLDFLLSFTELTYSFPTCTRRSNSAVSYHVPFWRYFGRNLFWTQRNFFKTHTCLHSVISNEVTSALNSFKSAQSTFAMKNWTELY